MPTIKFKFINDATRAFFKDTKKNCCLCGGFGSGKTYVACFKILSLLTNFKNYRCVIARQEYKVLLQTTFKTFMKLCPSDLIERWDEQKGYMRLVNGSEILWMHLDAADEQTLRGLEINSVYLDQPEEIAENIYDILDARVGRWDGAIPEAHLLVQGLSFNVNEYDRYTDIPSYMLLTPNPENETHWIYRRYHPESLEFAQWQATHSYYEVSSVDNPLLHPETLQTMLSRDPAWIKRFVHGQWGISEASIHILWPESILDVSKEFILNLLQKSNLYRALDHGDASPTCCLWFASYKNVHICYREYYQGQTTISSHRKAIAELSEDERYVANYADPSIFKQMSQKFGGFWSVSQEYLDPELASPPIAWLPADNNELSTRNRINEYLSFNKDAIHPFTGATPAPRLYFIKKSNNHEYGVSQALLQLRSQRRVKLGELNGKPIYSDDRDTNVVDHAYDPIRYFVASHTGGQRQPRIKPSETSFLGVRNRLKMLKVSGYYNQYGDLRPLA